VAKLEAEPEAAEAIAVLRRYASLTAEGPPGTARRSATPVVGAATAVLWRAAARWRETTG